MRDGEGKVEGFGRDPEAWSPAAVPGGLLQRVPTG